jgi:N-acetyl-1-D-myo-inositol-2-amino-2-deoxy-alpha-D-glucopyranoside deacetylase
VKAHHTTVAALDLLAGEGWQPARFYLHAIPRSAVEQLAEEFRRLDRPVPDMQIAGIPDEAITAVVDVRDLAERKRQAFAAHVSQNDPDSPFVAMAGRIFEAAFGTESFVLARGEPTGPPPERSLLS